MEGMKYINVVQIGPVVIEIQKHAGSNEFLAKVNFAVFNLGILYKLFGDSCNMKKHKLHLCS